MSSVVHLLWNFLPIVIMFYKHLDMFIQWFTQKFTYCSIIYLNPLTRIDEINEESWQFSMIIHDEGDGLTLCE